MKGIVGDSELTCRLTGEKTWKREVGFCFTADGRDIGREIVEMGMALACVRYSSRYVMFECGSSAAAVILLHHGARPYPTPRGRIVDEDDYGIGGERLTTFLARDFRRICLLA